MSGLSDLEITADDIYAQLTPDHQDRLRRFCDIMAAESLPTDLHDMLVLALGRRHPNLGPDKVVAILGELIKGLRCVHYDRWSLTWPHVVQLAELGSVEFGGLPLRRLLPTDAWPDHQMLQPMRNAYNGAVQAALGKN